MMEIQKKTNLFVVGAMKAGTTSFVDMISQHPVIYVPPIKEPHYFVAKLPVNLYEPSRFFNLDWYFENNFPKPLHITKIEKDSHYEQLYSLAENEKYLVDASTAYLHAPDVAEKIYSYNSEAKIIILLRDPLKRAYSHYKMDLGLGRTTQSFSKLISEEILQYHSNKLSWSSYMGMSFYTKQVKTFQDRFSNVLVLDMEDLNSDPERNMCTVKNFLGVISFSIAEDAPKNVTRTLRFQKLFFFLKKIGLKDYFSKLVGHEIKQKLFQVSSKEASTKIELKEEVVQKVTKIFELESSIK